MREGTTRNSSKFGIFNRNVYYESPVSCGAESDECVMNYGERDPRVICVSDGRRRCVSASELVELPSVQIVCDATPYASISEDAEAHNHLAVDLIEAACAPPDYGYTRIRTVNPSEAQRVSHGEQPAIARGY